MDKKISDAKYKFLVGESEAWLDEGLISAEARGEILGRYEVSRQLPTVVLTLGIAMIGIGLLSFIAANWQEIGRLLKIVMIIAGYAGCVLAAWQADRRGHRNIAGAFLLLSGFMLMGGIALMSQIFHIQGSLSGLLVVWLVAFAPTLLLSKNLSVYLLYEVVSLVYMNWTYIDGDVGFSRHWGTQTPAIFDPSTLVHPWQPLVLMLFLGAVAWWCWNEDRKAVALGGKDPSVLHAIFIGGATRRIFFFHFYVINWFGWVCVMNSTGQMMAPFFIGVAIIGALIILCAHRLNSSDLDLQGMACVALSGLMLTFAFVWGYDWFGRRWDTPRPELLICSGLLAAFLIHRIIRGKRGNGFAVFLFCCLLSRWYFDMFYSFMDKSMFFVTGGVILLVIAWAYRKWSRVRAAETPRASGMGGGSDEN